MITPDRLASLLRPRAVALIGATDKSGFSATAYRNLVDAGLGERTYLVNRRGSTAHGRAAVTSATMIGEPVDVAFLMVPQAATLDALTDAAAAGITGAVVLSAGYAEAGEAGRRAQEELVRHAQSLGMLLLGPNQLGFANFVDQIPVTAIPGLPRESGPVALLSQSGASSSAMVDFAAMTGVGLSYLVTLGNEAMVTTGHLLDYLVEDASTRAVAIFMEGVRDPDMFRRAARRAAAAGKAVVVLKAGRSELSARTAAAHTGALVGDDAVTDAVFADLGVIRVDTIEDMLLTAGTAARLGRLRRRGIGVVSISGGACDIVADRAADLGASLPELAPASHAALAQIMPGYGTVQNPLDVTGAAVIEPGIFTRAIEVMAADPAVGVVAAINTIPWRDGQLWTARDLAVAIGAGIGRASVPVVYVNQAVQPVTDYTRGLMAQAGIPHVIAGLREAVMALRNVAWWSQASQAMAGATAGAGAEAAAGPPLPVPGAAAGRGAWPETAVRRMLADAGVPVVPARLVTSAAEAERAAVDLGGLVAVKVVSPDIAHKSDAGGVALNVAAAEAGAAYRAVTAAVAVVPGARIEGALVSPMRTAGTELLVGVVRDPQWGPMLAVATGGIFVEVLQDKALAPLPVTPALARLLLERLRGAPLLRGARGGAAADLDAVAAVIARIGDLALALGDDLESLEVNPLLATPAGAEAIDAMVTWRRA
jgi:acyl-CoA synthetase (NDP forming)